MDTFCTYEQYYGLSGLPFAATTELGFYFESRGHRRAFAYVRHALREGDCFMVLTGDTGSGKTMLVRKLLAGLEADGIVAAQPTGSRLGASDVLQAVLLAFNAPRVGSSADESRAELRALLAALAATGRRGLAVFDEAQHLLPGAIDVLIEMAKPDSAEGAALQVLLIGQPSLRTSIPNAAHEPRQPFFLFCDIGLLSQTETRGYIEQRLRRVQWNGSPSFSDAAYERIYRATDGVPRRINRLCHRLLMAASGRQLNSISAELVDETHAALHEEIGGNVAAPAAVASQPVQPTVAIASQPVQPTETPVAFRTSTPRRSPIAALYTAPVNEVHEGNFAGEKTPETQVTPIPALTSIDGDQRRAADPPAKPDADPDDSAIPTLFSVVDTHPSAEGLHQPAPELAEMQDVFIEETPKARARVRWLALVGVLVAGVLSVIWLDYEHEKSAAVSVAPPATPARSVGGNVESATDPLPSASRTEPAEGPTAAAPAAPSETQAVAPAIAKPETTRNESLARKPERPKAEQRTRDARIQSAQPGAKSARATDRPISPKQPANSQTCTPATAALGLCAPSSTQ